MAFKSRQTSRIDETINEHLFDIIQTGEIDKIKIFLGENNITLC